jgi:replicative DNA helicase
MGVILPPHSEEAEESVIGSLLLDGDAIAQVVYSLEPEDFFCMKNQVMYSACKSIHERHDYINQITVANELWGKENIYGGPAHLSYLISICPTSLDIEHYAKVVKNLAANRALIDLGNRIFELGQSTDKAGLEKTLELVKGYQSKYTDMSDFISPKEAGDTIISLIDKYNDPEWALRWGFRDLDDLTAGLFPGELVIVGARPRTGKTQFLIDVAQNYYDKKILFVSAEMTVEHILERRVARELGMPIKVLRKQGVDSGQMDKIINLAGYVSEWGIHFLHPGVSSLDIYQKALKMKEAVGLDIVFVDYLQKLKDCYTEKENENIRIGRACQRLKDISTELNVPVVCASQFNRNLEYRSDEHKIPVVSDLRGSGSIEQDADVILLLWREGPEDPLLNIRMAKSRQVEPGKDIQLVWVPSQRRYGDLVKNG